MKENYILQEFTEKDLVPMPTAEEDGATPDSSEDERKPRRTSSSNTVAPGEGSSTRALTGTGNLDGTILPERSNPPTTVAQTTQDPTTTHSSPAPPSITSRRRKAKKTPQIMVPTEETQSVLLSAQNKWRVASNLCAWLIIQSIHTNLRLDLQGMSPWEILESLRIRFPPGDKSTILALENRLINLAVGRRKKEAYAMAQDYFERVSNLQQERITSTATSFEEEHLFQRALSALLNCKNSEIHHTVRIYISSQMDVEGAMTFSHFRGWIMRVLLALKNVKDTRKLFNSSQDKPGQTSAKLANSGGKRIRRRRRKTKLVPRK